MAEKPNIVNIGSLQNESSATQQINENFNNISDLFEDLLSTVSPGAMNRPFDMNGYRLINLPPPESPTEPLRLADLSRLTVKGEKGDPGKDGKDGIPLDAPTIAAIQVLQESASFSQANGPRRTYSSKMSEFASFLDYKPNNTDHDAFVKLFANNTHCVIPYRATDYLTGQITVPASVKEIQMYGGALIKPVPGTFTTATTFRNEWSPTTTYAIGDAVNFAATSETGGLTATGLTYRCIQAGSGHTPAEGPWWTVMPYTQFWAFYGMTDAVVDGLGVSVDPYTNPQVRCIDASVTDNCTFSRVRVPNAGAIGFYAGNAKRLTLETPSIGRFAWNGVIFEGADQKTLRLLGGSIVTSGIGIGTGAAMGGGGEDGLIAFTHIEGPRTFGAAIGGGFTNGHILRVTTKNTKREGAILYGSYSSITHCDLSWDAGVSQDFGFTFDGTGSRMVGSFAKDNVVRGSGSSGACIAGAASYNTGSVELWEVSNNKFYDCNQLGFANKGGLLVSGLTSSGGEATGNKAFDSRTTSKHAFCVGVIDEGVGLAGNCRINENYSYGALGVPLVVDVVRGPSTNVITNQKFKSYPVVLGAASGTLGSSGGFAKYNIVENQIKVIYEIVLTRGTGTIAVSMVLPQPGATFGTGYGWSATTGNRPTYVYFQGTTAYIAWSDISTGDKFPGGASSSATEVLEGVFNYQPT